MTHLTVSYSTSSPVAGSAAASGTVSPFGNQVQGQGDGGLGFLAALIDQLLAGSATGQTTTSADGTGTPATTSPVPFGTTVDATAILTATAPATTGTPTPDPTAADIASLAAAVDPSTLTSATTTAPTEATPLVKALTKTLAQLKAQLEAGQKPDPDLLKKLGDTAQALAALIATPTASAAVTITPAAATPSTPAIGSSSPTAPLIATDPTAVPALANNGPQSSAPPLPPAQALTDFAQQLEAMSQDLAPTAGHVADQLHTLAAKVSAAATDPQFSAQLATNTTGEPNALQALVRSLVPNTAPTATVQASALAAIPQFAPPKLSLSSPLTTTDSSKSSDDNSAQTTTPAPLASTSTKPSATSQTNPTPSDNKPDTTASKPEAKLIAAAAATDKASDPQSDPAAGTASAASTATTQVATPRAIPAGYQAATANPINMGQVAFEMVHQLQQGSSRFTIRLDPPELGRVDVKMHVDATGAVNARLTVDRSETLDMFQRDRGSLEKALTQAGLDSSKTNLEFSLRQNPFAGMTGGDQRQPGAGAQNSGARFSLSSSGGDDTTPPPTISLYRGVASPGGVNLFV